MISVTNSILSVKQQVDLNKKDQYEAIRKTAMKVACVAGVTLLALGAILILPIVLCARLYTYVRDYTLRQEIEKAQIKSLETSLSLVLKGEDRGSKTDQVVFPPKETLIQDLLKKTGKVQEAKSLVNGVIQLRNKIERLSNGERVFGGVEGVRNDLVKLMDLPLYRELKTSDRYAVNFLQIVSVKLLATDATDALSNYGKKCLGKLEGEVGLGVLSDSMARHLRSFDFSVDSRLQRAFYYIAHPEKALHSLWSLYFPLEFDSGMGNPNFSAHSLTLGGEAVTFYYGPGVTGNPIFEHGVLEAHKKFGGSELRFNYQNVAKTDENVRILDAERMANKKGNEPVFKHAVLGFDTKTDLSAFNDVDEFFNKYDKVVADELKKSILSEDKLEEPLSRARKLCKSLSQNNPFWELKMKEGEEGKKRLGKTMKLVADTFLALALSVEYSLSLKEVNPNIDGDLTAARISGACKQDIDRGIVANIALRLFTRWISDTSPLKENEVYEIAGAVLGRARLVDDRKIMHERFEVLEDFLHFIDSSKDGMSKVQNVLSL